MKDEEEFGESIDELISYDEADEVDDFSDFWDTDDTETPQDTDDEAFEIDEDEYDGFEIDEEYEAQPYYADEEEQTPDNTGPNSDDNIDDIDYTDDDIYYGYDDGGGYEDTGNEKKSIRRIGIFLVIAVIVAAIIAFLSIDTGFIGSYKANFTKNFSALFGNLFSQNQTARQYEEPTAGSRYSTSVRDSKVISPAGIMNAQISTYKDGIVCASANSLLYIDSNGDTVWEENTLIVDPILSVQGSYILIAEKGRKKLCLYNDKKLVYETDDPDNIITASVSSTGDCVLVTDKSNYHGGISAYNKTGEQIYSWASGSYAVIAADISSPSRKIAVSLLNTDTEAKSIIMFFDINETQNYAQINVEDTVIYNLTFTGNTLTAFGDNRMAVISENGDIIADNIMDDVQLTHSAIDSSGIKMLSYDNGIVPMIGTYDKNGREISSNEINGICSFIDVDDKTVIYSIGKDIYCGRASIGNMTKYTAAMDIKNLLLISQNTFVIVYNNSIEIVHT